VIRPRRPPMWARCCTRSGIRRWSSRESCGPEYTAFGQTDWSLNNQAMFLAAAACDPRDRPVMDLMGQVTGDQRWGLGALPDAKIKGGWGPAPSGRYLMATSGLAVPRCHRC
jgi:hypothetical protein